MAKFNRDRFLRELESQLQGGEHYAPLRASQFDPEPRAGETSSFCPEFALSFSWREKTVRFAGAANPRSSPRQVRRVLREIENQLGSLERRDMEPLLALPYLSPAIVELLEEANISGLDLNGNYLLQTDEFVAIRLDQENKYKESGGIKNVFRGTSSIVSRYLLRESGPHASVTQIHERIKQLDGRISLSTVSKVLKALDEQLIIEKEDNITLLQPEKLLERLRVEYRPPQSEAAAPLKLPEDRTERQQILTDLLGGAPWVWSGETSAERYATTTPSQEDQAFARELPADETRLDPYRDDRFYNCILRASRDDFIYFDPNGPWASPIQTYLDLTQGDKREREIARDIKNQILNRFSDEYA